LGHVPNAILFDWKNDINDPIARNVVAKNACEKLLQDAGVNDDTILVFHGDFNNWFAALGFWLFKDVRIMNGGRKKWLLEDRPLTKNSPSYPKGDFKSAGPDDKIRVFLEYEESISTKGMIKLVDIRSPKEFTGEILASPEYPIEHTQRGGHLPDALNIPWAQAVNDADGTFKPADQLKDL
jgi:thiosulfate/3-mercaptopyruvate sulfurtransferase